MFPAGDWPADEGNCERVSGAYLISVLGGGCRAKWGPKKRERPWARRWPPRTRLMAGRNSRRRLKGRRPRRGLCAAIDQRGPHNGGGVVNVTRSFVYEPLRGLSVLSAKVDTRAQTASPRRGMRPWTRSGSPRRPTHTALARTCTHCQRPPPPSGSKTSRSHCCVGLR